MQAHAALRSDEEAEASKRTRLETFTFALGAAFVVAFGVIASVRLFYPFEVSWMESAMYEMMLQRLEGRSMYVPPSVDYTPCLYPPLYFDVSAALARALGLDETISFLPMRLVSVASSFAVFAVTCLLVYRKKKSFRWSLSFAAIFLATYARFEFWHDSSRVDTFCCFWLSVATALSIEGRGLRSASVAGVCAGAAILTKQPAAPLMALAILRSFAVERSSRRPVATLLMAVGTVGVYLTLIGEIDNPFFYHYLFGVPASHPLGVARFFEGILFLPLTLPVLCIVAGASCRAFHCETVRVFAARRPWTAILWSWFVVLVALRAKQGANVNFFLPLVPVAILAAMEAMERPRVLGSRLVALLPYVPAAQLLLLLYDPRPCLPTREDAREARELIDCLRRVDGPVWFPAFPSYPAFAGKPWFAHEVALVDLAQTHPGLVRGSLDERIEHGAFGGLIVQTRAPLADATVLAGYRLAPLPVPRSRFLSELHARHLTAGILLPP